MNPTASRMRRMASSGALAGVFALAMAASPAQALVIDPTFDTSWASAPAGATTDVNNVIAEYEADFTNPVTIDVAFGWGELAGNPQNSGAATIFPQILSGFPNPANQYSFAATTTLLSNASAAQPTNVALATAVAHLPASYPNPGGTGQFFIPDAQYLALTGTAQNGDTIMAYTGYATDFCGISAPNCAYDFSGGAPPSNEVDFTSVVEHELAHAMGRVDWAFSSGAGNQPPFLTIQDFYKYDCGTPNLDPTFSTTCFSIDGDATNPLGRQWSNSSDSGDWGGATGDSYNAFINPGQFASVSSADITLMCAEGWDGTACVPEPSSMAILAVATFGLPILRRRRASTVGTVDTCGVLVTSPPADEG